MPEANKIQVGYIAAQDGAQFKTDEGTAAAPGLCFADSAATGMYSPGTGQVAFSTSGKQTALRILADGKVGIDCSPTVALEVNGTIKASAIDAPIEGTLDDWIVHAGDTNTKIGFPGNDQFEIYTGGGPKVHVNSSGYVGIGTTTMSNGERLAVQLANDEIFELRSDAQELFQVWKEGSTEECRINVKHGGSTKIHLRGSGKSYFNGGNVGIGENNPTSLLHLKRSSTTAYSSSATNNDNTVYILNEGAGGHASIQFQTLSGGTANTGQANINVFCEGNSAKNTAIAFGTRGSSGNPTEKLRITSTGNVGIGITNPSQQLEVNGLVRVGSFYAAGRSGTATNNWHFGAEGNGQFRFYVGNYGAGDEKLRIDSKGQISSRGSTTAYDGTGTLDALQLYYETDSGQASIGSYSSGGSTHLSFYTNSGGSAGVKRLEITSSGDVKIPADSKKFLAGAGNDIRMFHDGSDSYFDSITGNLYVYNHASAFIHFGTGGTTKMSIKNDGNVGINTAGTANNILDVRRDATSVKTHIGTINGQLASMPNSSEYGISLVGNNAEFQLHKDGSGNYKLVLGTYQGSIDIPLVFRTGNRAERLRIANDGKTGVNTGGYAALTSLDIRHHAGTAGTTTLQPVVTICAGRNSTRGLEIKTGRPTSGNQNDAGVYYNAKDSESSAYHAQHVWQMGGGNAMVLGYTGKYYLGIGENYPGYPLDISYTNNTVWQNGEIGNGIEIHNKSTTAGTSAGLHMYATGNGSNAAAGHITTVHTANGTGDMSFALRHNAGGHSERMRLHSEGNLKVPMGVDQQGNGTGVWYTPGSAGYVGTQFMQQGSGFLFFMGNLASSSSSNATSNYVNLYASHHWGDYPRVVIFAAHHYYQVGWGCWTFGCKGGSSPQYALTEVENWGGTEGNHGSGICGSVSVNHAGHVATYSNSQIHRYELTMSNTGTYQNVYWYVMVTKAGRGIYSSDTSVSNVDSSCTAGGCVHLKTIPQTGFRALSYLS